MIYSTTEFVFSIPNVKNFLCNLKTSLQSYCYRPDCFTPKWCVLSFCCMWCESRKFILIFSGSASQPASTIPWAVQWPNLNFWFYLRPAYRMDICPCFFLNLVFLVVMVKSKRGNKIQAAPFVEKRNWENDRMKQSSETDVWHLAMVEWTLSTLNSVFFLRWKIINL